MERLVLLFPALITVSALSAIVAFFFLQSRAQGVARLLIILRESDPHAFLALLPLAGGKTKQRMQ